MPAPKGEKGVQGITGRQGFPGDRVRGTEFFKSPSEFLSHKYNYYIYMHVARSNL